MRANLFSNQFVAYVGIIVLGIGHSYHSPIILSMTIISLFFHLPSRILILTGVKHIYVDDDIYSY
ncbi:hypothetical protein D2A38_05635 [Candidatus Liberibacter asiaticus]|nr:hypothetical protein D2A38_05635 [Candidatus Liberibacter asiaticus]